MTIPVEGRSDVGLIVPPSNPTLEGEIRSLLGEGPRLHCGRLPYRAGLSLAERNAIYLDGCLQAARRFGSLPLAGVIVGCTGSFYGLGPQEDARRCRAISDALGLPYITSSLASLEMIRRLGFRRVQLELPYPDWLIEAAAGYFEAGGLQVSAAHSLLEPLGLSHPYDLPAEALTQQLQGLQAPADTLVFLSGTGIPSAGVLGDVALSAGLPLLSANLCIAGWLLERLGPSWRGSVLWNQLIDRLQGWAPAVASHGPDRLFNPYGSGSTGADSGADSQ